MNKIILFLIGFFFSIVLSYGQCNVVKDGDFTGGIASTWVFQTPTTGWYYNSSYSNQAYIQQDNLTTRPSLKQTVNGLLGNPLTLSFKVSGQNFNRASGNTSATLEIRLGNTTYATILNPVSNTTIAASNITAINGATLISATNFPINTNTTPLGQGTVTLTIPWSSKPTTADLEFVQTLDTGDDWVLDDIVLSAPLPTAYSVTGGGSYCTGGTGVVVGLNNSQLGANYQLQRGGFNTGSPVAGTGSPISFGNQIAAGNYTVVATNAGSSACTVTMTGSAVLSATTTTWKVNTAGVGSWDNGVPTLSTLAILDSDYDTATANIDACSLTINAGLTLLIRNQNFVTIQNDLTVNDNAVVQIRNRGSLVMINNLGVITTNGSGKFNVNKTTTEFEKYDYTYWSTPLSGTTTIATVFPTWRLDKAYAFHPENFTDKWNYATGVNMPDGFDDDENDWLAASTMNPGRGYIIMGPTTGIFPKTESVVFSGKVNTGTVNTPINLTPDTAAADDDFNLVGNPYPCAISADALIKANIYTGNVATQGTINQTIDGTLYFWTHKADIALATNGLQSNNFSQDDYAIYTLAGGTGTTASNSGGAKPLGYIASGQGFFVEGEATGLLTFNNSMRVSPSIALTPATPNNANSQFYKILPVESKSIDRNRIWLNLENDLGMFSQQLVGYFDNTTLGFDKGYDGLLSDAGNYINFYSFIDNATCKIQARPTFAKDDEVSLGYFSGVAGTFNINIDSKEGVFENNDTDIFIEDQLTSVIHNLKESPYSFETESGTFDDRFVLRYKGKTLGTGDFDKGSNQVLVSVKNKQIKINSATETIDKVLIYDMLGKQIFSKINVGVTKLIIPNLGSSEQVLIVKTLLQNGQTVTTKLIY